MILSDSQGICDLFLYPTFFSVYTHRKRVLARLSWTNWLETFIFGCSEVDTCVLSFPHRKIQAIQLLGPQIRSKILVLTQFSS